MLSGASEYHAAPKATVDVLGEQDAKRMLTPSPLVKQRKEGKQFSARRAAALDRLPQIPAEKSHSKENSTVLPAAVSVTKPQEAEFREESMAEEMRAKEEKLKLRQAKEARKEEALVKACRERRTAARELESKLQDSFQKAEEHVKAKYDGIYKVRENRNHHLQIVAERREQAIAAAQEEVMRRYLEKEERSKEYMEVLEQVRKQQKEDPSRFCEKKSPIHTLEKLQLFLEEQQQETKYRAVHREKYVDKIQMVNNVLQKRQEEREESFRETVASLVRAEAAAKEKTEERAFRAREAVQKRFEKQEQNLQKVRKESYEKRKQILERMSAFEAAAPREKHLAEESQRRAEQKDVMQDLVAFNIQRLESEGAAR